MDLGAYAQISDLSPIMAANDIYAKITIPEEIKEHQFAKFTYPIMKKTLQDLTYIGGK